MLIKILLFDVIENPRTQWDILEKRRGPSKNNI